MKTRKSSKMTDHINRQKIHILASTIRQLNTYELYSAAKDPAAKRRFNEVSDEFDRLFASYVVFALKGYGSSDLFDVDLRESGTEGSFYPKFLSRDTIIQCLIDWEYINEEVAATFVDNAIDYALENSEVNEELDRTHGLSHSPHLEYEREDMYETEPEPDSPYLRIQQNPRRRR